MSNIVEVRGISKRFGDFEALRNVTFDIAPGSIVGLIGPNGAGKTTTLKSILGLTDFEGDKLELVNDTDDTIADAVITETGDGGSTVTWDELTIVLDVVVTQDDFINPITD